MSVAFRTTPKALKKRLHGARLICEDRSGHKWPTPAQKKSALLPPDTTANLLLLDANGGQSVLNKFKEVI